MLTQKERESVSFKKQLETTEQRSKKKKEDLRQLQGFLLKQGHKVKNWKTRYFVINEKDHQIVYYTNHTMEKEQGRIPLNECVVEKISGIEKRDHCFLITTPKKIYLVSAASTDAQEEWIEAIQLVVGKK